MSGTPGNPPAPVTPQQPVLQQPPTQQTTLDQQFQMSEPVDLAWRLLKDDKLPDWMHHYPTEAMSKPTTHLEWLEGGVAGAMMAHPNAEAFKAADYPMDRVEEFFGPGIAEADRRSRAFSEEWVNREKEEEEMGVWDDFDSVGKPDYAPEVFMEHQRHNIMPDKDCPMCHEMVPTFGNVNVREPAGIHGVEPGPDMQNYPLMDMEEDEFSPFRHRPTRHGGFSDVDQLKYASEPVDLAIRLLKDDDDFMRDYFYQTARDSGIPEEEIDRAWEESRSWEQPIPESTTGEYHPGDKGEGVEGPRRHFPTQLRHRDASPGLGRSVQHDDLDEGTFRDTPFNEATHFRAGEPMEIAMRLLKQGLELQPPPTQGVEETPPIQEDIPTVNVDTMSGGGDCCEEVRAWLLRGVRPNTKGYDKIMNASCEEIKSGQIGKTKFLYDKIAEIMGCSEGFSSDFQDIHTGEPMGIAMRLLKQQTHIGDWMDDPDYTGTPNVPFVPPEERAQFSPGALWVAGPGTGYPRTPEGMNALVGGYQLMHGEKPIGHVTQNIQQPLQTGGFRIGEASINPEHRGKGLYQRLLTSILGVQGGLESRGSRNRQSQRSHEMLQEALGGMPGVVSRSRSDYPGLPPAPGFPVPDDFDWARYYHDLDKAARHDYRYRRPESPEGWGSLRPMMPGELPVRSAPEGPRPGPTDGRLSQRTFDPSTGDMATYHSPSGYFGSTPWGEELPERTVPQRVMP